MVFYRFRVRGGTAADLATVNEVLYARELCYETDTGKAKLGDGATAWNALPYLPTGGGGGGGGSTWYHGSGAPAGGLGADGDFYLDDATGDVYAKAAGAWTVALNIKGADGADGADGVAWGQFVFGAGDRINTLLVGPKALVPVTFAGIIKAAQLHIVTNDGLPGSIVVDVWKCSYSNASATRPDSSDTITSATPPTIAGGSKAQDSTLAGWTTTFAAGDVLVASVLGRSANVAFFALSLDTEKTP